MTDTPIDDMLLNLKQYIDILIVEDDAVTRAMLRENIETVIPKCRIVEARDGEEALAALNDIRFDVIILDLHLPKVDGITVLQEINRSKNGFPVVYSGFIDAEIARQLLKDGAKIVLDKSSPEDMNNFIPTIERFRPK